MLLRPASDSAATQPVATKVDSRVPPQPCSNTTGRSAATAIASSWRRLRRRRVHDGGGDADARAGLVMIDHNVSGASRPRGGECSDPLADLACAIARGAEDLRVLPRVEGCEVLRLENAQEALVPLRLHVPDARGPLHQEAIDDLEPRVQIATPLLAGDLALEPAVDEEVTRRLIARLVNLREHLAGLVRQAPGSQERHALAERRREPADGLAKAAAAPEGWPRMNERVDEDRHDRVCVDRAEHLVQHVAETVVDLHRVRRRYVELGVHEVLGAGERDVAGNVERAGKPSAIGDRLREEAHHEA